MLYTYDFKQVICLVGGLVMQGFADGENAIALDLEGDLFSDMKGADGEVARSKLNDMRGNLNLRFMHTSPSNDILSGFMIADITANAGAVPILLKDGTGRTTIFGGHGWVRKPPQVGFGTEVGTREWPIRIARVDLFIGGTTPVPGG